jgi:hypothetical protein
MNVQEVRLRNFAPESRRLSLSPDRCSFRQRDSAVAQAATTEAEAIDHASPFAIGYRR